MRWRQARIVINGRYILPKSTGWLYCNPQIAIGETWDNHVIIVDEYIPWGFAPRFNHRHLRIFRQRSKICFVIIAT